MFHHVDPLVASSDGGRILASRAGEILGLVAAANGFQRSDHVLGDLARVKGVAPVLCHPAQHLCLPRCAKDVANVWRLAVQQVMIPRPPLKGSAVVCPVKGHTRGDWDACVGIMDRRGQQRVQA